jgi:hypothetical protein
MPAFALRPQSDKSDEHAKDAHVQSEEQNYSKRQDRLGSAADLAKRNVLVHLQELLFPAEPSTVEPDEIL